MIWRSAAERRIFAYAQGFSVIGAAVRGFEWNVDRAEGRRDLARGLHLRSALLDDIAPRHATRGLAGNALYSLTVCPNAPLMAAVRRAAPGGVTAVICGGSGPGACPGGARLSRHHAPAARTSPDLIAKRSRDFLRGHGFERGGCGRSSNQRAVGSLVHSSFCCLNPQTISGAFAARKAFRLGSVAVLRPLGCLGYLPAHIAAARPNRALRPKTPAESRSRRWVGAAARSMSASDATLPFRMWGLVV